MAMPSNHLADPGSARRSLPSRKKWAGELRRELGTPDDPEFDAYPVYTPDGRRVVGYLVCTRDGRVEFFEGSPWLFIKAELPPALAEEVDAAWRDSGLDREEFLAGALNFYLKAYQTIKEGGSVDFVAPGDQPPVVKFDRLTNADAR